MNENLKNIKKAMEILDVKESIDEKKLEELQKATHNFKMLPETFYSFSLKGHENILNPIDNAIASINYIMGRYGSFENLYTKLQESKNK